MPKKIFQDIKLPQQEPDQCIDCPLLGLIPESERPKGSQQVHVCLGTAQSLSKRMAEARKSAKDKDHQLDRPCKGGYWQIWQEKELKPGYVTVRVVDYVKYRMPQINCGQLYIKFRKPRNNGKT